MYGRTGAILEQERVMYGGTERYFLETRGCTAVRSVFCRMWASESPLASEQRTLHRESLQVGHQLFELSGGQRLVGVAAGRCGVGVHFHHDAVEAGGKRCGRGALKQVRESDGVRGVDD